MQPTETRRTPCAVSVDLGYTVLLLAYSIARGEKTRKKAVKRNDATYFFCDLIQKYIPSAHFPSLLGSFGSQAVLAATNDKASACVCIPGVYSLGTPRVKRRELASRCATAPRHPCAAHRPRADSRLPSPLLRPTPRAVASVPGRGAASPELTPSVAPPTCAPANEGARARWAAPSAVRRPAHAAP